MSSDIVLSVREVSKRYEIYARPVHRLWQMLFAGRKRFFREFWALRDVSFDVRRGEPIGVIGRNGAGKSTLLKIITGTLRATSGSVWVKPDVCIAALLELGSGFNPEFTGRENVYLNASILGMSRRQIAQKFDDIVNFADIGDFIDQPVRKYSSGMKLRLAFAVQVMIEPDVLIVDEALAVGDMFFRQKCLHYMRKLCERGMTLFLVSHDISLIRSFCPKAAYLRNGTLVAYGDAQKVCDMYFSENGTKTSAPVPMSASDIADVRQPLPLVQSGTGPLGKDAWKYYHVDRSLSHKYSERVSSGQIEFVGFSLRRLDGCETASFACGETIVVVASLRAVAEIPPGAVFGLSFSSRTVQGLIVAHSLQCEQCFPAVHSGEKFVVQTRIRSPFYRERWFVNFSLKPRQDEERYYDHVINAIYFDACMSDGDKKALAQGIVCPGELKMSISKIK